MCGIFGIVTKQETNLGPTLIEAGKMLSYRGYDSVGCATINAAGEIDLRKDAGKVDAVAEQYNFAEMSGQRGILQLRWATFGAPSKVNSQPHLDSDGDLVGAHNGNVVNNAELRKQFMAEGMTVRSENDGESCIHAVERYVNKGFGMVDAIRKAYEDLKGDYAFVIGRQDEDVLYAIKKGSGLVAGIIEDGTVVSSDLPSLLPLTRQILRIEDGEIAILRADGIELRSVADGSVIEREVELVKETMEAAQKGNYPHFMLKEIHEQPVVAGELLNLLDNSEEVDAIVARIKAADNIYLAGCGTSYHACLLASVYFSRLAGRATIPVLATQFIAQYGPAVGPGDVGMFVSQSGETKDVLNAIESAEAKGMGVLGLVNVVGSTLMRVSEHHIPLGCGYEISVPATKTFTNQMIAFLYLALRMGGHDTDILHDLPELMRKTIAASDPQAAELADSLVGVQDFYQLGYGMTYPMALEGALKLKEITYLHCEGMLSTEFKHGPLSAVEEGYPVVYITGREDVDLIVSGINEATCRGGWAIVVGPEDARLRANGHEFMILPETPTPEIEALLTVIPLQLLSYHLSLALGYDPDFPRNLSKTLTVD
jgi:glucosamine--fructose-6-phosphate aminotransferase (isomerizing)